MTKEQIFELLREEIKEITWKSQEDLTTDTTLKDLGFDSLDNIELIMRAEKKTSLSIPDEDVERVSSVGEMVDYLFERLKHGVEIVAPKKEVVSEVRWQTGEPKETGTYIVTTIEGFVGFSYYESNHFIDKEYFRRCITAWCKLSDIKPYKE